MDEDTDSNWVLVDEVDCAEEAVILNPPPQVTSVPATPDSDQESDGSISIISDHPTDSYSEEETETPKKNNDITVKIMPIIRIDTEFETDVNEEEIEDLVQKLDSPKLVEKTQVENDVQEIMLTNHQTSDDDVTSISVSSSKQWTYADEKSKLELDIEKTFFLDCSQEPILEVSANDADIDTDSTASTIECQAIVQNESPPGTNISSRDLVREREVYINRISIGFLISMLILTSSHLIREYLDYSEDGLYSPSSSTSFLDSLADNEKARPILNFCIDRQKAKGVEYSDQSVEKCVIKRLRKKNREDAMKKTEIYLQMKERILELREKELVEKERDILKKWRKRMYKDNDVDEERKRSKYDKKHNEDKEDISKTSQEFNKKFKRNSDHKEEKSDENHIDLPSENEPKTWKNGKIKTFRKRSSWVFENAKQDTNWNYKMHSKDDLSINKNSKKASKDKEETMKNIKDQVKNLPNENSKQKFKGIKGDRKEDPNEEWYIKYNPVKNTIELINITTLPEQDSELIRNGNKTINGQWYFSLYGSGRTSIRNKERAAEWYFRRGSFREHKRDKAKWYFDYMSARDNTRYFY